MKKRVIFRFLKRFPELIKTTFVFTRLYGRITSLVNASIYSVKTRLKLLVAIVKKWNRAFVLVIKSR